MRTALVCGAGGFIGSHLVKQLKEENFWVRGVDLKHPEFAETHADDFITGDLRDRSFCESVIDQPFDEVYQLAADMGGAGYINTGENDADVMHNSLLINLHVVRLCHEKKAKKVFYSSSACVYPEHNQLEPDNPNCAEHTVYPANPDSEYGWEKLMSERLYLTYNRNYGLDVRIARFHNIFGHEGIWDGGKEKAPAALCRKVAAADHGSEIEIWGDGNQTRSFLHIEECLQGIRKLMDSNFKGPINIGSDELISIKDLAHMIIGFSEKDIKLKHIDGPQGVRGRNSDNSLVHKELGWKPSKPLSEGMKHTYEWINKQVNSK
jgi:GDP-D-mannose 3',5'-epimerase